MVLINDAQVPFFMITCTLYIPGCVIVKLGLGPELLNDAPAGPEYDHVYKFATKGPPMLKGFVTGKLTGGQIV